MGYIQFAYPLDGEHGFAGPRSTSTIWGNTTTSLCPRDHLQNECTWKKYGFTDFHWAMAAHWGICSTSLLIRMRRTTSPWICHCHFERNLWGKRINLQHCRHRNRPTWIFDYLFGGSRCKHDPGLILIHIKKFNNLKSILKFYCAVQLFADSNLDFCEIPPNRVKIIIEEKKEKLIKNWQLQHKEIREKMTENLEDEKKQEMTKTKIIVQHKISFFIKICFNRSILLSTFIIF